MTGSRGRRCTHGNVLSLASLMVVRLGYSLVHLGVLLRLHLHRHGTIASEAHARRLAPPGKIEVNTIYDCARSASLISLHTCISAMARKVNGPQATLPALFLSLGACYASRTA